VNLFIFKRGYLQQNFFFSGDCVESWQFCPKKITTSKATLFFSGLVLDFAFRWGGTTTIIEVFIVNFLDIV
jgi:hypothetical protein